jgi:Xaa-Pro aminopeptidase
MSLKPWNPIPYDLAARRPWRHLSFSDQEYQTRIDAIVEIAVQRQLDGIVVCGTGVDFANVRYITGFPNHCKGEVVVILPVAGAPIMITNAVAHGEPMHIEIYQSAIEDVRCAPSDRSRGRYAESPSLASLLSEAFRELRLTRGRIGIAGTLPVAIASLQGLSEAHIEDCSEELSLLRAIKSPAELAVMRQAAEIADAALLAGLSVMRPGAIERHVAAAVASELHLRGAEEALYIIQAVSGPRSGFRNVGASDRRMEMGDPAYVGFGLRHRGYCGRVGTGTSVGQAPAKLLAFLEANAVLTEEAVALIRPGVSVTVPVQKAVSMAQRLGVADELRAGGHGIGVHTHDRPYVQPGGGEFFSQGMVFVFEPVLYRTGFATANAERVYEVTSDGCVPISKLPLRLWMEQSC